MIFKYHTLNKTQGPGRILDIIPSIKLRDPVEF